MPDKTTETEAEAPSNGQVIPFAAWLQDHRGGAVHAELTSALHELALRVAETGKSGTLTFAVTLKPEGKMIVTADKISSKLPEETRPPALYFTDGEGNLLRDNPEQTRQPLREVPAADLKAAK